jgi:hypothetical protein
MHAYTSVRMKHKEGQSNLIVHVCWSWFLYAMLSCTFSLLRRTTSPASAITSWCIHWQCHWPFVPASWLRARYGGSIVGHCTTSLLHCFICPCSAGSCVSMRGFWCMYFGARSRLCRHVPISWRDERAFVELLSLPHLPPLMFPLHIVLSQYRAFLQELICQSHLMFLNPHSAEKPAGDVSSSAGACQQTPANPNDWFMYEKTSGRRLGWNFYGKKVVDSASTLLAMDPLREIDETSVRFFLVVFCDPLCCWFLMASWCMNLCHCVLFDIKCTYSRVWLTQHTVRVRTDTAWRKTSGSIVWLGWVGARVPTRVEGCARKSKYLPCLHWSHHVPIFIASISRCSLPDLWRSWGHSRLVMFDKHCKTCSPLLSLWNRLQLRMACHYLNRPAPSSNNVAMSALFRFLRSGLQHQWPNASSAATGKRKGSGSEKVPKKKIKK